MKRTNFYPTSLYTQVKFALIMAPAKQYYTIGNVENEIDACHYGNKKF